MKESEAYFVYRLVKSIDDLREMKKEIDEKFMKIDRNSTDEEIREFYVFLVKSGYCSKFREAIVSTQKQIDKHIKNLEKQLKEL
jgi:predicted DNA-binding transcriptional regulator